MPSMCEVKPSGDRQTDRQASHAGLCEPRQGGEASPGRMVTGGRGSWAVWGCLAFPGWAARGPSLVQLAAGTGQMGHDVVPRFPEAAPPQRV